MANENKRYYWLKLHKDFFKRHDIKIIEGMPNGKDYVLFYLKLLVESIDHEGDLRFNETIPYDENMLATITNTNVDVVRSAVKIFRKLGLMEILDDLTIHMNETNKMLGVETDWAKRKREYKARKTLELTHDELPTKYPYVLGNITVLSREQIAFKNGVSRFVDEKRYGGNGKIVLAKSNGFCQVCNKEASEQDTLVIHHTNDYSNNVDDLVVLCKKCHSQEHARINATRKKSYSSPNEVRQEIDIEKEKEIEKDIDLNTIVVENPDHVAEVITYLNEKAGKRFSAKSISSKKFINGRLNDGYTVDDLKRVIDVQCGEWKGTTMAKYLRPETLFNETKFQSYISEVNELMLADSKVTNLVG